MKLKFAVFISSLYAATVTHAEGFYALGAVGQSHFKNYRDAADDALTADTGLTAAVSAGAPAHFDNLDTSYKLQLGYAFDQNFAIEGGYVDLGQQHYDVTFSDGSGRAKVGVSGWNIDAVGTVPVSGPFSVFGKLGAIDAEVKYHLTGTDASGELVDGHKEYKWSPNFGVGTNYAVNDNAAVRLELERFADLGKKNTTGEQNVDLVSLGISYRFN